MSAKDLLINDSSTGKAIEAVREGLPQFNAKAALAFVVEAIDAIDRCTFMISSQDEEIFRIFYFICEQ